MMQNVADTSVAYVPGEYLMTDDKAPVELLGMQVIDQLIQEKVAYYKWIYEEQGISGVSTTQSAWSKRKNDETATQIDMIIERKDNIVNMCEIKFYGTEFAVDKSYDKVLRNRISLLSEEISKKMAIHSTLITTFGLKYNEYSGDFVNVIDMDDLFE